MRERTVDETTLLASRERVVGVRLEIQNVDGTWREYTNLSDEIGSAFEDLDFFIGASWENDIDAPTWTGTVTLAAERIINALTGEAVSIAPYMETSPANVDDAGDPAPAIEGMRRIRWFTTTEALDGSLSSEHKVFDGFITEIEQKDDMTLQVSDLGHELVIAQIEDERVYEPGLLEDRIQNILDDNMGVGAFPLVVDPGIAGTVELSSKFKVERGKVMQTIRDLAFRTVGANVRYMWNGENMELRLFMPPRDKVVADFTYDKNMMYPTPSWKEKTDDVRNKGRHYFTSKTKHTVGYTEYEVPASIAKYKKRYFEFKEGVGSELNDEASSKLFLQTAINDLAQPKAEKQFTSLYNWAADVYDLYTLVANNKQYSTNQSLATTRVRHTISASEQTTQFDTRGNVAGFSRRWISVEGKGKTPPNENTLTATLGMGAEGSMYGNELWNGKVDGTMWLYLFIGAHIKRVHIWHRETVPGALVTLWPPTSSDMYKAVTLERPEGAIPRDGNFTFSGAVGDNPFAGRRVWRTIVPLPTTPDARAGVIVQCETFGEGTMGPQERLEGVATDPVGGVDPGGFASLDVVRDSPTNVHVTLTPASAGGTVLVFRDGINIDQIDVTAGTEAEWDDPDLHANRSYKYQFVRFANNMSGVRETVLVEVLTESLVFANDTPKLEILAGGEPRVRIEWSGAPVGTTHILIRKSRDSGHYDVWQDVARVPIANAPYLDVVVVAGQFYQLQALDADGVVLDTSQPIFWASPFG